MHLSNRVKLLKVEILRLRAIARLLFLLISLMNIEVAKNKTSFWALEKTLQNNLFYYNYNTYAFLGHMISYPNNFGFYN